MTLLLEKLGYLRLGKMRILVEFTGPISSKVKTSLTIKVTDTLRSLMTTLRAQKLNTRYQRR